MNFAGSFFIISRFYARFQSLICAPAHSASRQSVTSPSISISMSSAPSSSLSIPPAAQSASKSASPASSAAQTARRFHPVRRDMRPSGFRLRLPRRSERAASFPAERRRLAESGRALRLDDQRGKDVVCTGDQPCAVADEHIRQLRAWAVHASGRANTSRPFSIVRMAVLSAPLRFGPSVTSVPRLMPAIMRLRCKKLYFVGTVPADIR